MGMPSTSVAFVGPVFGEDKNALYRSASLFILPSHSENFGIVVAEALAHGVPVMASTGTPWEQVVTERCGWWISIDEASLEACLRQALSQDPTTLRAMGENGRLWMRRDFSWESIANRIVSLYRWNGSNEDTFVASPTFLDIV